MVDQCERVLSLVFNDVGEGGTGRACAVVPRPRGDVYYAVMFFASRVIWLSTPPVHIRRLDWIDLEVINSTVLDLSFVYVQWR